MRQLNNIHFDTIEGASAHQGEIVSSQLAPSVSQKDENKMEIKLEDKVLLKKSDYENMLSLLVRTQFVITNSYDKDGSELVNYDNRDEGTQLFSDISSVIRIWDEDSPINFMICLLYTSDAADE